MLDDLFNANKPEVESNKEAKDYGGLTGLDELEAEENQITNSPHSSPDEQENKDGDFEINLDE